MIFLGMRVTNNFKIHDAKWGSHKPDDSSVKPMY